MIKIEARLDTEGGMSIAIEGRGPIGDLKKELREGLYQTYKQIYDTSGIKALHELCEATKDAMGDVIREVFS